MGFKENLLKKMGIEKLAGQVAASVRPPAEAVKFDKAAARRLLEMGGFPHVVLKERDLELYVLEEDAEKKTIIALDNGLAIYHTTIDDVAMRKNPTVKEMLSIRNARKILSDDDVLVSKRADSVRTVRDVLIDDLDLTYTDVDISGLAYEGAASLEGKDSEGVMQALALFSEMLGFQYAPKLFRCDHCEIRGSLEKGSGDAMRFGPAYVENRMHDTLKFIASAVDSREKEDLDRYIQVLDGNVPADAEGNDVFQKLRQLVADRKPVL
jgi:hypothetical protein